MEGPEGTSHGTVNAALAATAQAVDAHTAEIAALGSDIAAVAAVPHGAVIAFRTAAEITAAGAGWSRETALDGRILLGAGTAGGQTFTEANNYGSNWSIGPVSENNNVAAGSVQSGGGSTAVPAHGHTVNITLIPPSRAYVYARQS